MRKIPEYEVAVLATVSNGKTTFINALLGKNVLPTQNMACTAKLVKIKDNDRVKQMKVMLEKFDGSTRRLKEQEIDFQKLNSDKNVKSIIIEDDIKNIRNIKKKLLLVDTPGVNNSEDNTHKKITEDYLINLNEGLIIYVLNVEQLTIHDNNQLLQFVKKNLETKENMEILFILNKVDSVDNEKEGDMNSIVMHAVRFLEDNGFKSPKVIPVSSYAAVLFNEVIAGHQLSRLETNKFRAAYELFKDESFNMEKYAIIDERDKKRTVEVEEKEYLVSDLQAAIKNTGIPLVEHIIENMMIAYKKKGIESNKKVQRRVKR